MNPPEPAPEDLAHLSDVELDALLAGLRVAEYESRQWVLQPRQQRAEDFCRAAEPGVRFEILYGGAVGGGKSLWELWHLHNIAIRYPRTRCLMLRRSLPELRRNAIYKSHQFFDRRVARWVESQKEWRFDNGSVIELGYLDNDLDVYQYQGAEYACVCWDELTQWPTNFPYVYLLSRLRTSSEHVAAGLVPHMVATTNPGGVGGHWVKAHFVDLGEPEVIYSATEQIEDVTVESRRVYVPAKLEDNRYIDRNTYIAQLAGMSAMQRKALLSGSWDVVEGQYFGEWDRAEHVIEPFAIPSHWTRVRAIDFGFAAPACCLWAAFDSDGTCYVYRELYGTGMTPPVQARRIVEMTGEGEHVDYTVADPSVWIRTGAGAPIAQQYQDAGIVSLRRAMNARVDGWSRLRAFLRPDPDHTDPDADDYVPPRLFVFSHCRNLIRTLPMLVYDRSNPEDCSSDGEDHAPDALRYLVMSRPRPTHEPKIVDQSLEARLKRHHEAKRAQRKSASAMPWVGRQG